VVLPALILLLNACSDSAQQAGPITGVLAGQTSSGEPIPSLAEPDGVRVCRGDTSNGTDGADLRFRTFDGVPLAVFVTLVVAGFVAAAAELEAVGAAVVAPVVVAVAVLAAAAVGVAGVALLQPANTIVATNATTKTTMVRDFLIVILLIFKK
jgi:hypothetical protein